MSGRSWVPSDELDAIPVGSAAFEREHAKRWMNTAAQHHRNESYWRHRASIAEAQVDELEENSTREPSLLATLGRTIDGEQLLAIILRDDGETVRARGCDHAHRAAALAVEGMRARIAELQERVNAHLRSTAIGSRTARDGHE